MDLNESDLRVDVYRATGHGGQSVNTTDSAIRITHIPTGLVVTCQDEKSQLKNRIKAMAVLRARLYDLEQRKRQEELGEARRSMVGTGDRSEKIRTYNFRDDRVTDHRIKSSFSNLPTILDGDLDRLIDALQSADQAEQMATAGA
ncbi:MAG: peptide chain release factor-like protein [Chloroflexia bacterium]